MQEQEESNSSNDENQSEMNSRRNKDDENFISLLNQFHITDTANPGIKATASKIRDLDC
jgi:hypothetical protein